MPRLKDSVSSKCPKVIIKIYAKLIGFKGNVLMFVFNKQTILN